MLTIQMFDCTSFVFLLLARHSPQAAFGSQGKKILHFVQNDKGLGFGRSLRGTLAGLRRPRLRPALKNRTTRRHSLQKPLFASSAAFHSAIASQRLLRASAHVRRAVCRASVWPAGVGLLPRLSARLSTLAVFGVRSGKCGRLRATIGFTVFPCAASKHLHEVAFLEFRASGSARGSIDEKHRPTGGRAVPRRM